jgi:hypothetical protein
VIDFRAKIVRRASRSGPHRETSFGTLGLTEQPADEPTFPTVPPETVAAAILLALAAARASTRFEPTKSTLC